MRGAALALAAALWLSACGGKATPRGDEGSPAADSEAVQAAEDDAAPPPADAPAAAAPAAAPLTPEEDSAREARAFRRRQQSMESYESCMAKVAGIDEPARTTLQQACARSRGRAAAP